MPHRSPYIMIGLIAGLLINSVVAMAWSGPPASAPTCPAGSLGCSAPVNVGTQAQVKNGDLGINFLTTFGDVRLVGGWAPTPSTITYLNFSNAQYPTPPTWGSLGYGIRDNNGTLEFKDSLGTWKSLATVVTTYNTLNGLTQSAGKVSQIQFADGTTQTTASAWGGQLHTTYITSGTSWTSPANITSSTLFEFTLVGGGGGGGSNVNGYGGGGGGGGAMAIYSISGLVPNTAYAISIGTGGAGSTSGIVNGINGGLTSIVVNGVTVTANGGNGGSSGLLSCPGGPGGTATNATFSIPGTPGGANNGNNTSVGLSGDGGTTFLYGIPGRGGVVGSTAGKNAAGYGGGGGGGLSASGGAGSPGLIVVRANY